MSGGRKGTRFRPSFLGRSDPRQPIRRGWRKESWGIPRCILQEQHLLRPSDGVWEDSDKKKSHGTGERHAEEIKGERKEGMRVTLFGTRSKQQREPFLEGLKTFPTKGVKGKMWKILGLRMKGSLKIIETG